AERLSQEILSLPMHPGLTVAQVDQVVSTLRQALTPTVPMLSSTHSR
ncbi:erythromycin biosynthesis sensory transduction protein eryC1, partial [Haemophilus parainfluenzae]